MHLKLSVRARALLLFSQIDESRILAAPVKNAIVGQAELPDPANSGLFYTVLGIGHPLGFNSTAV
jgi:hypothetical protein